MNIKQLIKIHSICFKRKLQLTILIEALGAVYKGRPANGEGGGFEISDIPGRGEGGGL